MWRRTRLGPRGRRKAILVEIDSAGGAATRTSGSARNVINAACLGKKPLKLDKHCSMVLLACMTSLPCAGGGAMLQIDTGTADGRAHETQPSHMPLIKNSFGAS